MYPSMLRTAGDWFADFEQLQDRIDELLTGRSMTSSIRAVGRAGRAAVRRVIALPEDAEPSRVEATYRNGVLKVVVPKRESSKPRQIPVSSDR